MAYDLTGYPEGTEQLVNIAGISSLAK
jgi:hypothetical protein